MAPRLTVRWLLAAMAAAWVGCAAPPVRPGGVPERGPARGWLFYTDSDGTRLVAVHPDSAAQIDLEPGPGKITHPQLVVVGHRDAATGRLAGVHAHAVVYLREDPAGVATVHTAPAAAEHRPAPRQVSRLALPFRSVCGAQVVPEHARPEESLFALDTVSADGDCSSFEHRGVLVRLSMDASAEPLQMRPMVSRKVDGGEVALGLAALYTDAGAVSHLLVAPTRELGIVPIREPSQAPRVVAADKNDLLYIGWDRVWLVEGGRLRFHVAGGVGRDPGGVATPASREIQAADGRYLYFVDGLAIRRVGLDGSSPAQTVHTAPDGTEVTHLAATAGRVLFRTKGSDGSWLWSVPKQGGGAVRLLAGWTNVLPSGQSLFEVLPKDRALALREDGTDRVTLATGAVAMLAHDTGTFAGGRYGYASVEGSDDHELVLVDPDPGARSALRLRRVDPTTRVVGADLGTLPAGYTAPVMLRHASGGATLLFAKPPGGKRDAFLVETTRPGSLRQLTRTPELDEAPVGPVSCGTGGGTSLLALGGLWLVVWRRRHGFTTRSSCRWDAHSSPRGTSSSA